MKKIPVLTPHQKAHLLGDKMPLAIAAIDRHHPPFRLKPPKIVGPRHDRMTILAGIICKEFIVLGADSRWTNSTDGSMVNADKISIVNFGDDQVMVGQAGLRPITTEIVETMRKKAIGISITEPRDVTKIVKDSIRETKTSLDPAAKLFGKTYGAALMIAFYAQNRPHFYTCHIFGTGIPEPAESQYATAGCADMLANYFLSEFSAPRAIDEIQLSALIYTIMKVKENNAFCGGPTTIKYLTTFFTRLDSSRVAKATTIDPGFIERFEKALKMRDEQNKPERNAQLIAVLREVSDEFAKEHWQSPK